MFDFLKKNNKRAEAMAQVAAKLNMSYVAKDEYGTKSLLADFKLFQRGGGKLITNFLHKKEEAFDLDAYIFDYRYIISTGKSAIPITQTVFFIQAKQLELPQFLLKPEHFFHRIGTYLGMQDIDFVSDPEFSDQYLLQGEDEDLIRKRLTPDFRHFFTVEKNWTLEGLNYFLIFYRHKKVLPPEDIYRFYDKGMQIFQLLNN